MRDEFDDLTPVELLVEEVVLRVSLGRMTTSWGWLELPCLMGMRVTTWPAERWREDELERFFFSLSGLALREEQSWCLVAPQRGQAEAASLWSWSWMCAWHRRW